MQIELLENLGSNDIMVRGNLYSVLRECSHPRPKIYL